MHINCYLNQSFEFLLPKSLKVPDWIEHNSSTIIAFVAGYTDAEGSFIINQTRSRFKIDSYDLEILTWIVSWLQKQKIRVKFRRICKKGDLRSGGAYFKHDLWRIGINEPFSLLEFIKFIIPFAKHGTRLKDMMVCEENILEREVKGTIKHGRI